MGSCSSVCGSSTTDNVSTLAVTRNTNARNPQSQRDSEEQPMLSSNKNTNGNKVVVTPDSRETAEEQSTNAEISSTNEVNVNSENETVAFGFMDVPIQPIDSQSSASTTVTIEKDDKLIMNGNGNGLYDGVVISSTVVTTEMNNSAIMGSNVGGSMVVGDQYMFGNVNGNANGGIMVLQPTGLQQAQSTPVNYPGMATYPMPYDQRLLYGNNMPAQDIVRSSSLGADPTTADPVGSYDGRQSSRATKAEDDTKIKNDVAEDELDDESASEDDGEEEEDDEDDGEGDENGEKKKKKKKA